MLCVYRVSENAACKMPVDNLATVFGPTVVGYSSAEPTMSDIMQQTKLQQLVRFIHSFISGMHRYECIAPNVDVNLQSGPF